MYVKVFKRFFDVVFSIILMPFFLILYIVVGIAIKLDDGGPIFYCGERLGRYGKPFKMYKFRSMKVDAPDIRNKDGSTFNSDDDPRLTKIGRILRKTSIDEVPQILNVLKGDMSFIGPRPDLPGAINKYSNEARKKLNVRPGISGYNQAYYRNSVDTSQKFKNDVYYVDNISFIMDLKIFFKTIQSVLFRKNIYVNEELKKQKI